MALRLLGPRGVGVAILVLTLVMLVAGEITPKTYAATNAEKLALLAARPVRLLETLFFPAVKGFSVLSASIVRLMGGRSSIDFNDWALTVEEVERNRIRTVRIKKQLH